MCSFVNSLMLLVFENFQYFCARNFLQDWQRLNINIICKRGC